MARLSDHEYTAAADSLLVCECGEPIQQHEHVADLQLSACGLSRAAWKSGGDAEPAEPGAVPFALQQLAGGSVRLGTHESKGTRPSEPTSVEAYALAGYAKELGLNARYQRYAEYRVLHPEASKVDVARAAGVSRGAQVTHVMAARIEKDPRVIKYMAALVHVASGRSLSSLGSPEQLAKRAIGDTQELLELLWRAARFRVGDYVSMDGTPDLDAIRAAGPGVFSGLDYFENTTTTVKGDTTVSKRWRVPAVSPQAAQLALAKILNVGHVNDPSSVTQVQQTVLIQALGKMSDGALKELQGALVGLPQGAPQGAVTDAELVPACESSPAATAVLDHAEATQ
jgi:hypothetical protein